MAAASRSPPARGTVEVMRAAFIEETGPVASIRIGDIPVSPLRPHELRLDVLAASVNPVDLLVRSGRFPTTLAFPQALSRDAVGRVVALGEDSRGFEVGDLVWTNSLGHAGRPGAAAEQVNVDADRAYPLPPGTDPVRAVAVVHPAATAYLALTVHGLVRAGETVLVVGAGGNVGSATVEIAAEAGARVVAVASAADAQHCHDLGATFVVDYADPGWPDEVRDRFPRGIDVHVDAAGVNDLTTTVDLLGHGGRAVVLAGMGSCPTLPVGALYTKDASVRGFAISHATTDDLAAAADVINRLLRRRRLGPRSLLRLPLDAAARVHTWLENGVLHGRRAVLEIAAHRTPHLPAAAPAAAPTSAPTS